MTAPRTYAQWLVDLAPPRLQRRWGAGFLRVLGTAIDRTVAAAKAAVKARMVALAPADALPYLGRDRGIDRYYPDTDETYRARLLDPWTHWEFAGTPAGLLARLGEMGYLGPPYVRRWRDFGWLPRPFQAWWSAFQIRVPVSGHPYGGPWKYGDGSKWGEVVPGHMGAPPGVRTFGSSANHYDVAQVRKAVRKYKPTHEIGTHILFELTPVAKYGDGSKWGDPGFVYGGQYARWRL